MDLATGAMKTGVGLVTNVLKNVASITQIGELPALVSVVPLNLILLGHCLAVAGSTKGRGAPLYSFVLGFVLAFGGSIASNLFLGTPTGSILFQSNTAVIIWSLSWWIINRNPLEIVNQILDLAPVGIAARACMQLLRSGLVVSQVQAASKAFPGLYAPAIIAGTLAGCGGKVLTDILNSFSGARGTFEVAAPTYALRSSLVGSAVFYVTVNILGAFTPAEGAAVVMLAFLSHTLSDDLLGSAYDYTVPVINVFTTVTLIDAPKKRSASRGRAAAPASQPTTPRSASKGRRKRSG